MEEQREEARGFKNHSIWWDFLSWLGLLFCFVGLVGCFSHRLYPLSFSVPSSGNVVWKLSLPTGKHAWRLCTGEDAGLTEDCAVHSPATEECVLHTSVQDTPPHCSVAALFQGSHGQ